LFAALEQFALPSAGDWRLKASLFACGTLKAISKDALEQFALPCARPCQVQTEAAFEQEKHRIPRGKGRVSHFARCSKQIDSRRITEIEMPISFHTEGLSTELNESSREARFLSAWTEVYRNVFACALSVVADRQDAEDVIQQTCAVLWEKYDEFEPGTNFNKWAATIAFKTAKAFVRQKRRHNGYGLSDHILAKVVKVRTASSELIELRRENLRKCISRLNVAEQKFLLDCYRPRRSLVKFARATQIPLGTIHTRLKRLRQRLSHCIQLRMKQEEELE